MATLAIVVFQTLDSKHDQDGQPPAALVAEIKKQDGLVQAFYGPKMEDAGTSVLCTGEVTPPPRGAFPAD